MGEPYVTEREFDLHLEGEKQFRLDANRQFSQIRADLREKVTTHQKDMERLAEQREKDQQRAEEELEDDIKKAVESAVATAVQKTLAKIAEDRNTSWVKRLGYITAGAGLVAAWATVAGVLHWFGH